MSNETSREKNQSEMSVEQKLKMLYDLQTVLSQIDEISIMRGELPNEVRNLEDEIEGLNVHQDKLRDEIKSIDTNVSKWKEDLSAKKSELDDIIRETKVQEDELREKAKEYEDKMDVRLLKAFKRIRKNSRNGLGIVYVQRDACGGCFNKIPPQRQLDIRMRKKVIVCEYCGRIMIDPELAGVIIDKPVEEPKKKSRRGRATKEKE